MPVAKMKTWDNFKYIAGSYYIKKSILYLNIIGSTKTQTMNNKSASMILFKLSQNVIAYGVVLLLIEVTNITESQSMPHTHGYSDSDDNGPVFLANLSNTTVPIGRDISFTCVVDNLGEYRVAWIKSDTKAILGIHTHMVSLNSRLSVTHNGHNTWKIHISRVQINDSGSYMCQINTDPMKSISGYLDVVVPPDILNHPENNLEQGISTEGGSISLVCSAIGVPKPKVQWRRDAGKEIMLRTESKDKQGQKSVEGETLVLTNVHRTDMGGYNCIASNGIPPSVSKRFDVFVNFPPEIKAINQLVAAPVEREVTLECIVEVYPKPLNGWYRSEGNIKLHSGNKFNISEEMINLYTWHLNLTIKLLNKADFGTYSCSSINALGKSESRIRLQELRIPPKVTTTSMPHVQATSKPRRKQQSGNNKGLNEVVRAKETHFSNQLQQVHEINSGGIGILHGVNNGISGGVFESVSGTDIKNEEDVITYLSARNGYEKTIKPTGFMPSPRIPWIFKNTGSRQHMSSSKVINGLMIFVFILFVHSEMLIEKC